ncbi:MAG: hypothetical protein H7328_12240 [Bdellovibrio sp.]|nr:hypothetical protein [Bdellovibrio sp.]
MKKIITVLLAVMTSAITHASEIPFQKLAGKHKISDCSAVAEGRMLNALQEGGNGANPCDTFDEVVILAVGTIGFVSLHKSADKVNSEVKAVEGKSLAELNAVLARTGLVAAYGVNSQAINMPEMQVSYSETDTNMTYSSVTNIGETKTSVQVSFQADSSGKILMNIKDSEKYSGGDGSELSFTGTISQ